MARGTTRAPSQNAYRGSIGRTQTSTVHVVDLRGDLVPAQVRTTIDAVSDPDLVDRLYADTLNVVHGEGGEPIRVSVPVVYHDPAAELLVLVLTDAHRHRELDERIRLLERLREDQAAIPAYAKEFVVVYGPAGLRAHLDKRAQEARAREASGEAERGLAELTAREEALAQRATELAQRAAELELRATELAQRAAELEQGTAELARRTGELDVRAAALDAARAELERSQRDLDEPEVVEKTTIGAPPTRDDIDTKPSPRSPLHEVVASPAATTPAPNAAPSTAPQAETAAGASDDAGGEASASQGARPTSARPTPDVELDEETTSTAGIPAGSDPLTSETIELALDASQEPADRRADKVAVSTISVGSDGQVRLALVAGEQLARGLAGTLDVRILLHRTPAYPVITLVLGTPAGLRAPRSTQLAIMPLDIALDGHRAVLAALAKKFELVVDVNVRGRRARRLKLVAPLAENVGYIVRAAEDYLRGLAAATDSEAPSFDRGRDLVFGAGFDLLGSEHPDAAEFRDDKLAQRETAQQLRRAVAMARRFARPAREDYLVCTRGFPLPRWRALRRQVVESAVAWGLWMGPELAQVAVSEGLARSRRDLVLRLDRGFEALKRHPTAFDIDADAAEDNAKAIAEEARALGVELPRPGRQGVAIASNEVSAVSGSISGTPPNGLPKWKSVDDLLVELDDRQKRVAAALELCERAEPRAAEPVITAVTKMSRAEAVRVLGMSVKFGEAAAAPLTKGLASSKAFLRHGCALALALLRTEQGTQAVIDLLLNEPTEIWREVARAIGQVGPSGLMPLASNFGRLGERATPQASERVAWAMAHIAVRGGKAAVEAMARGQSVVAPVAQQALALHGSAARDQVRVRPGVDGSQPGRDVTVNRAFSRRFFEALEQGLPDAAQAGLEALDASGPMELLDDADLLVDDDDEAELDEADLIQG